MFHGRNAMFAESENGCAAGVDDVVGMCGKFNGVIETKAQPASREGREDANARGAAGVQAGAG
jgi:hypothetical protein